MYTAPYAGKTNQMPASANKSSSGSSSRMSLKAEDFINMMLTQLQNQDPTQPAKNDELLAQMSQIGQLQSSTSLQDSLKGLVLQNQIGSAANLIGKSVQGMDPNTKNTVSGTVTSIKVQDDGVSLELDSGRALPLANLTAITPGATGSTTAGATTGA